MNQKKSKKILVICIVIVMLIILIGGFAFAFVATVIPKKPARVEKTAPIRKQIAVCTFIRNEIAINKTTAKIIRILYSENRKALAPTEIASAISRILSFPASFLLI